MTERFLRECHEIFVVCNIGRAVTDVGVEDVFKLAVQAKQEDLRNVGIVCTRSDVSSTQVYKEYLNRVRTNMCIV